MTDLRTKLDSLPEYLVDVDEDEFLELNNVVNLFRMWRIAGDEDVKNRLRNRATNLMKEFSSEHELFLDYEEV